MRRAAALGAAAVLLAGCATKHDREGLADLELYGADGAWSGLLTREHLTVKLPDGETLVVRNMGFPCPTASDSCFFGDVGGSRYVNWRRRDGRRLSLVADRKPCGRHPYAARLYFHQEGRVAERFVEGCAGPPSKRGR